MLLLHATSLQHFCRQRVGMWMRVARPGRCSRASRAMAVSKLCCRHGVHSHTCFQLGRLAVAYASIQHVGFP